MDVKVNVDKLRGVLAEKRMTPLGLSKRLGISHTAMYQKMENGKFSLEEANKIIDILELPQKIAVQIFLPAVLR